MKNKNAETIARLILELKAIPVPPVRRITELTFELRRLGGIEIPEVKKILEDKKFPAIHRRSVKQSLTTDFFKAVDGELERIAV